MIGPNYNVADAWITAALASLNTKNIKIVAAVQPGFKLPAVVANLSANIQNQLSNGRFALISCPLNCLLNPKNPTPAKATLCLPSPLAGRGLRGGVQ